MEKNLLFGVRREDDAFLKLRGTVTDGKCVFVIVGMVRAVRIESARPQVAWETQCRKNSLVDRRHEDFASQVR